MPRAIREAFRVVLVEAQGEVLHQHRPEVRSCAAEKMVEAGVELVLGRKVLALERGVVCLEGGEEIGAEHVLWAGGLRAPRWLEASGLPLSEKGRILVNDRLEVHGQEQVFAVGDAVERVGEESWPRTAYCAVQQGPIAANNVLMDMVGASLDPFEYIHWGDFIRMGERDAILDISGVTLTGALAWTAMRVAHVLLAPTSTKKVALFAEWSNNLLRGSEIGKLPVS
jgi:NADH dehydrogenase